jgi:hypothetical protein
MAATQSNVTGVLLTDSIVIQSYLANTPSNVSGVPALYPSNDAGTSSTYWTIYMTIVSANGGNVTYTINYYGLTYV